MIDANSREIVRCDKGSDTKNAVCVQCTYKKSEGIVNDAMEWNQIDWNGIKRAKQQQQKNGYINPVLNVNI